MPPQGLSHLEADDLKLSKLIPLRLSGLVRDLGAYLQSRAIEPGRTGNITPSAEGGTAAGGSLDVEVLATSRAGNKTGGLPSNSNLQLDAGGRIESDPSA